MAAISSIIALGGLVGGNLSIMALFTARLCVLTDRLEGGKGEAVTQKGVRVTGMEVTFDVSNGLPHCK